MSIITKVLLGVSILLPVTALPLYSAAPEKSLTLVSAGKPQAIIVTAAKPTSAASLAAGVLADHIRQISGASISIVSESDLKNLTVKDGHIVADGVDKSTFIVVGESSIATQLGVTAEGLGAGGIRLRTVGNALVLLGADNADKHPPIDNDPANPSQQTTNDRNASIYAVIKFLEDQLGVRYLWPGEMGKVIPKREAITVAPIDISYTPIIKQRHIRHNMTGSFSDRTKVGLNELGVAEADYPLIQHKIKASRETEATSPNWFVWQGLGGSLGLKTGHSFGYAWDKYGKEHPEWFAMQPNGSRDQSASSGRARFDISNKDLHAAIARDRIEELDRNPNQVSVSIDPNDGGYTTFCLDEACRALDPPGAELMTRTWIDRAADDKKEYSYQLPISLTDRMVYFWNGIAEKVTEKHPNALLTVRAYSTYKDPPVMRKLHPNIVVEQVSADYFDVDRVAKDLHNWTEWAKFTQNLAWRPNIDAGNRRHGLPVIYVHRMAADVKARVQAGMIGTDVDSLQKNWSPNALNIYVLARLFWDPSQDVDAIIDDYCRAGFGKGAPYIKKYFSRIEEITMQAADTGAADPQDNRRGRLMITTLARLYDPATLEELNGLLDQAKTAAQDEDVSGRVEFMRISLALTSVQATAFRMIDEARESKEKIDKKAVLPFMEKRYAVMRYIFLNHPAAYDIPYLLWGSEGNFRALQSKESWQFLANRDNDEALQKRTVNEMVEADEFGEVEIIAPAIE